jgi:hypothetical protein
MESRWMQVCVRVPKTWDKQIHVNTVAPVNARKLIGSRIVLDTVPADVHASRITAEAISLKSVSGDIRAERLTIDAAHRPYGQRRRDAGRRERQKLQCTTVNGEQRYVRRRASSRWSCAPYPAISPYGRRRPRRAFLCAV